ncbi:MAG: mechanosensitive ion channel family protein [Caulobacteraceae bacterium]|nr:mechanosensitive ion channel family protein [Caulobacter sp.]
MWRSINGMVSATFQALPKLAVALVVFILFWFFAAGAKALIKRSTARRTHANVGVVLGRLAQWALLLVGLLVAVAVVAPSVKPANVISVLGLGSVAIGFAFKDILQNFVAGILLLLNEPFRVGDQIVFESFEGTVQSIDTRATLLKTYDGRRVVVPNGEIYTKSFIVNTAFASRRAQYDVGIGYGDDIGKATALMLEAMRGVEGVLEEPGPDVVVTALADFNISLRARWWTKAERTEVVHTTSRVLVAIRKALTEAQVDLPYPTQVVLFHDQTDANDGDRTRQREGWPAGDSPPPKRDLAAAMAERAKRPAPAPPASEDQDA